MRYEDEYEDDRLDSLLQPPDEDCPFCNGDGFTFDVILHEERRCRCTINKDNE